MANFGMRMLFGQNYMPSSENGQSMHDAMLQRNRSTEFMNLQRSGFMNNGLAKRLGAGGNPVLGMLSGMASPDSALARTMSPFVGGNPMAAQMQVYAGLAGAGTMGNFGRMSPISAGETEGVMQSLEKKFYKTQAYEGAGGVREEINQQGKDALRKIAKGPNANKVFADLGLSGITVDDKGDIQAKGKEIISNFNVADDGEMTKKMDTQALVKKSQSSGFAAELDNMLKQEGGKPDKDLRDALLAKVKKTLGLAEAEVKKFKNKKGEVDVSALRTEINALSSATPLTTLRDQAKAAQKAGGATKGFDFENSRGFKLEDFTSGFVKAADLRMLGNQKGKGVAASAGEFAEAAGGAMSAARSVFGNLSGSELVGKISNVAGSEADLGSTEGAGKVEDLLRKVNSTARTAGISIKTMLAIIDAGKQLASNHPALQSSSSAAISELSMKAVGTAVSLGSTMSATDYRKAGAAQGIASNQIRTAQEYAAGPVGSTIATAYFGATEEQKKKLDALVKDTPVTGRSLDQGLRAKMAEVRGMSAGELARLARDNPELVNESMKDTHTANQTYGAATSAFTSATLETLERRGLSTKKLEELYKESNGDFSAVEFQIHRKLSTPNERRTFEHAKLGIQERLANSMRSPGEKTANQEFEALRNQGADDEKLMDKKYASRYAPIITQALDVLGSGIAPKDMTGALASIFVTKDDYSEEYKSTLASARKAGEQISIAAGTRGYTDEQKIKQGGMTGALNDFISKRREMGGESTHDLRAVSDEDLITSSKMGSKMGLKDTAAGEEELAELQKLDPNLMVGTTRDRLTTLETWKKLGILRDSKALSIAQRGGAAAQGSAAIQAAASASYTSAFREEKKDRSIQFNKELRSLSETGGTDGWDANYLKDYYTTALDDEGVPFIDTEAMLTDKNKGVGAFSKEGWGDDTEHWNRSRVGSMLSGLQEGINKAEQRSGVLGETSPELKSREDFGKILSSLVDALGDSGGIGKALSELIAAINTKF